MQKTVPKLLRVREAAELTGLERWRFYELLRRGKGPRYLKIGRTFRIPEHSLIKWIDERARTEHSEEEN